MTRGWGPEQLAQLFAYYESVLHSVREGVVLIDPAGRVVMYNDQAAELLGLEPRGQRSDDRRGHAAAGGAAPGTQPEGALRIGTDRPRRNPSDRFRASWW